MNDTSDLLKRLQRNDPTLSIINLHHARIGNSGVKRLAQAISNNTHVVVLFLNGNDIGSSGCEALAACLSNKKSRIRMLFMSYNAIGTVGASALATALKTNTSLQVLKLASNGIGDVGAQAFGEALAVNRHLETLVLDSNTVGPVGMQAMANGIAHNSTLETLDVRYNACAPAVVAESFVDSLVDNNVTLSHVLYTGKDGEDRQEAVRRAFEYDASLSHDRSYTTSFLLEFYVKLNRLGRHSFGSPDVPASCWPRVLASASMSPTILFAIARARPDLVGGEQQDH